MSDLPSVSNFPGGNEIQRAGGFAMPLRDLLRDPLDRPGLFYPSPKFFRLCVCKSPMASKAAGPLWGRRWGGLSQYLPGTAFAWVILGRNVCAFGIGNGISWGRFLPNDPVFRCPSRAHTHNAAMHESANFPNVTDPHE